MQDNPTLRIEIQGHCNGNATEMPGIDLSRARAVYDKCVELGIAPSRMQAMGFADRYPKTGFKMQRNANGEFNQNMRVEIKLIK